MSTQRRETSCRQENSTEITSRKRSDCKLQELCNNCERTVKNNEGTTPKTGKKGSIYRQSSGILKMCTDVALLRKRRCVVFDERKWFNVKVYRDLMIIRYMGRLMGKGTQRQNFQFLFFTDSYGGFNEEISVENRLKKYRGITKLRHFS